MNAGKKRARQMHAMPPKDGTQNYDKAPALQNEKTKSATPATPVKSKKLWTDEEVLRLRDLVKKHLGQTNMWAFIASQFPGRKAHEVRQRATRDARSGTRYRRWSFLEERDLHDHVSKYGEGRWALFIGATERSYNNIWFHWQTMKRRAGVATEKNLVNIIDGVEEYLNVQAEKNERKEVYE